MQPQRISKSYMWLHGSSGVKQVLTETRVNAVGTERPKSRNRVARVMAKLRIMETYITSKRGGGSRKLKEELVADVRPGYIVPVEL
jgi:hypothetical protein